MRTEEVLGNQQDLMLLVGKDVMQTPNISQSNEQPEQLSVSVHLL